MKMNALWEQDSSEICLSLCEQVPTVGTGEGLIGRLGQTTEATYSVHDCGKQTGARIINPPHVLLLDLR